MEISISRSTNSRLYLFSNLGGIELFLASFPDLPNKQGPWLMNLYAHELNYIYRETWLRKHGVFTRVIPSQRGRERGHNLIRRTLFSQNTMEWLCYAISEASKVKGNSVRRWKLQDHFTKFFCSRNYNKHGRYISIISLQGKARNKRRSTIIIPEMAFNTGWTNIAVKISNFIKCKTQKAVTVTPRNTEDLPYSETIRRNKWTTREMNEAFVQEKDGIISISARLSARRY
ncbi:uncharacterized protein LOC107798738 isoform X2 [Nicotiana tabacum]|uniref:Uncharacterized protein n=2 Tax=Nicotiana tabacum TaxID=4097 RepID=A0A1S4D0I5_TOBAC|nr:PREDICTED: uncharacterized protein LOC107824615 [Nicotiana tabacum]